MRLAKFFGGFAWFCTCAGFLAPGALARGEQPAASSRRPEVWAIVIGVDRYEDRAIPGCPGAPGDARAVRDWLVNRAGWNGRNVLLMDPDSPREHRSPALPHASLYPSRVNLDWALREWIGARVRPNDVIVVYYAGQAAGVRKGKPGMAGRGLLLPMDARGNDLAGTGWAVEDALDALAAKGENPILVLLDTSLQGRGRPVPGTDAALTERWLDSLSRWPSVAAWVAATSKSAAEGAPPRGRSAFVEGLLEAFGTADDPRNLLAALDRLRRSPALGAQGFRTQGGVSPDLTLWSKGLLPFALPPPELLLQQGHGDRVFDLAMTPDGAQLLSSGADSTIRVWRSADRVLLKVLAEHLVGVSRMVLSRDGRRLAGGDGSGRVAVWSLPEYRLLEARGPRPHEGEIAALEFLGDGSALASLDADGKVVLWDVRGREIRPRSLADEASAIACGEDTVAVAVLEETGSAIRTFRRDGSPARPFAGPGSIVINGALAIDGTRLAAGDKAGTVVAYDLASGNERFRRTLSTEPVVQVRIAGGAVVAAAGETVFVTPIERPGEGSKRTLAGPVERLSLAPGGGRIGATTRDGRVHVWNLGDPSQARPVELRGVESQPVTALAFAPDGRTLVAGSQGGVIHSWSVPEGEPAPAIPAHRGQVAGLSVSDDGRYVLVVTRDRRAQLWDLQEGRTVRPLDGLWTSGAFLPGGRGLVRTDPGGEVDVLDRGTGRPRGPRFARPPAQSGEGESRWALGMVAVSADGSKVAAASAEAPLAAVWETASGRLLRVVRDHPDGLAAIEFSADGKELMTAGRDGTVGLHNLVDPNAAGRTFAAGESPIASARLDSGGPRRLVTGHVDGRVLRWEIPPGGGPPAATPLGRLEGAVRALAFGPDGAWLVAGGDEKSVRFWSFADGGPRAERIDPRHAERVGAIAAWPGGGLFASGSDDATVRLWRAADRSWLGTLAAAEDSPEWVVYTPDGQFDCSPGAESRVTWLREGRVMPLDQFHERYRVFGLGERLRHAERPPLRFVYQPGQPPPALAIDRPPSATAGREVELAVTLGEDELEGLRLYHNGIPVRDAGDFRATDPAEPRRRVVRIGLKQGRNTFYVMAGRKTPGSVEGRSNAVEVRSDAPEVPGRLHVLALGVDAYRQRPLKFSAVDARSIARFFEARGISGAVHESTMHLLTDSDVTEANVRRELAAIRRVAKPEDTVVFFLSGHTAVRKDAAGRERFCLLLPGFPLSGRPVDAAGLALAQRGSGLPPDNAADDPATLLPYAAIYGSLVRLDALQRLVILDACQAEAARDDPAVRRIRERVAEKVDDGAQAARTSYIFAARRDEPAFEVSPLKHGLLTHVLLRGMGAGGLEPDPAGPLPVADRNGDKLVTTEELRRYVEDYLPVLAAKYLGEAARSSPGTSRGPNDAGTDTGLRVQSAEDRVFPVVRLP